VIEQVGDQRHHRHLPSNQPDPTIHTGDTIMTTNSANGRTQRKTLSAQLDRLDSTLDGLAEALNGAVAAAVKEAVAGAVREAVQAVLSEVLANPDLVSRLRSQRAPAAAPAQPTTRSPTLWQRLGQLWNGVRGCVNGLRRLCVSGLTAAGNWVGGLWSRTVRSLASLWQSCRALSPFKYHLLAAVGVGTAVAVGAWFAGPWLAALLSGLGGFAATVALQGWLWLRRTLGLGAEPSA
jgi:hypothetical protein